MVGVRQARNGGRAAAMLLQCFKCKSAVVFSLPVVEEGWRRQQFQESSLSRSFLSHRSSYMISFSHSEVLCGMYAIVLFGFIVIESKEGKMLFILMTLFVSSAPFLIVYSATEN